MCQLRTYPDRSKFCPRPSAYRLYVEAVDGSGPPYTVDVCEQVLPTLLGARPQPHQVWHIVKVEKL